MINDLREAGGETRISTQVCLVGGGTAAIFLAQLLRRRGIDVAMLEAGDASSRRAIESGQECLQQGIPYRGAEHGRSFGLGGTSALWGGQMLPLSPGDFEPRPAIDATGWPISRADIAPYWETVRELLGLGDDPPDERSRDTAWYPELRELSADFELRLSTWIPFRRRNFAQTFAASLRTDPSLAVWLNATVVSMRSATAGNGRIEAVIAKSRDGGTLNVSAAAVVICAGALESTRLLLEFDEASNGAITGTGAPLGRYFADHLSATCGRFDRVDRRRYNVAVAPRFAHGLMRTPRMELSAAAQRAHGLASAFVHFPFKTRGDGGFDVLRSFLRRRQGERKDLGLGPGMLGRVASDVCSMAYWRAVHRRLWIPREAELLLQVDIEQRQDADSRLRLCDERDSMGRKKLSIDWRIHAEDRHAARRVARMAADAWQNSALKEIARLQLTAPDDDEPFDSLYDVYHPTGTLRMGTSAANSVVDEHLRLWAAENAYVTSTAVFPSAGSANPGMTHLALTARLAERIAGRVAASPR